MRHPVIAAAAVLSLSSLAWASTWDFDPAHSSAQFKVKHMMITDVKGEFGKMTGVVNLDDKDVSKSTAEATIDATTINTRVPDRDKDLKSPNFFDVEKYPTITFKSTSFKKTGEGKYTIAGDLTMHGVTKPVVLDVNAPDREVKDPRGNARRGVSATTRINRKDFGMLSNKPIEAGGVLVGYEVDITLDVELAKKASDAAKTN